MKEPKHIVAVCGLLRNPAGQVLMIKSPDRGWETPGGVVEQGEDLINALHREVLEETGVQATIGSVAGVYMRISVPQMVLFTFLGNWRSGNLQTSAESIAVEWVDPEGVLQRVTHPTIHDRIQDMLDFQGKVLYRVYSTDPYRIWEQRYLS